jgi:O-antigen/teichoic acid export membrane protein
MEVSTIVTILQWVCGIALYFYFGYLYLNTPKVREIIKKIPKRTKERFSVSDEEANSVAKISLLFMWVFWFISFATRLMNNLDNLILHPILYIKLLFKKGNK